MRRYSISVLVQGECFACAWGCTLLGVFALGAALYLGVGIGLRHQQGVRGGLREMVPHRAQWAELRALVEDGAAFVRGGGRHGGRGAPLLLTESEGGGASALSDRTSNSSKSKKSSKAKQSKAKKKKGSSSPDKVQSQGGGGRRDAAPPPPPPPPPPPVNLGRQETEMTDAFGRLLTR